MAGGLVLDIGWVARGQNVRNNASGRQLSSGGRMAVTGLEALVWGTVVTPLEGFLMLT